MDLYILATGFEALIIPLLFAGTAVGTIGAIQAGRAAKAQGQAEQDILNFNAQQKIKEAEEQRAAAAEEAAKFAKEGKRLRGTQRVAIARAGVLASEGTPALLLEETAQELEADRMAILKQGFLQAEFAESQAFGLRFQGKSAAARGKAAKRGSLLAAGGTLLTGLGSAGLAKKKLEA
jgi:hypothetical protein